MNQLEKRVLTVGAGLTPNNRPGVVIDLFAMDSGAFAVALHVALLEVIGKIFQGLRVRQNGVGFRLKEIVVPNTQQAHDYRDIFFERRAAKMLVGQMCTHQQLFEIIHTHI